MSFITYHLVYNSLAGKNLEFSAAGMALNNVVVAGTLAPNYYSLDTHRAYDANSDPFDWSMYTSHMAHKIRIRIHHYSHLCNNHDDARLEVRMCHQSNTNCHNHCRCTRLQSCFVRHTHPDFQGYMFDTKHNDGCYRKKLRLLPRRQLKQFERSCSFSLILLV